MQLCVVFLTLIFQLFTLSIRNVEAQTDYITMKKVLFISVIAFSAMLTSCSVSQEATSNQNQIQTSIVLNQKNYKVIETVTGESKQNYVLGIGGLSRKSLRESAMSDMLKKANLKGEARAIINTNVQYKNQFYIIRKSKCSRISKRKVHFTKRKV